MSIPEDTLLVIDSMLITAAVAPHVYKVVGQTDKMVELVALNVDGTVINADNVKTIRKTSIVSIINSLEDFQSYREMNKKISDLHEAYREAFSSGERKINLVKKDFQAKLKEGKA